MHPEPSCLVAGRRYYTPFSIVTYCYRFATKLRIIALFHSREKLIHIYMNDFHQHLKSCVKDGAS